MARYRHKDDQDLTWNRIRRKITSEIRVPFRDAEEEVLNDALTKAWDEFTKATGEGKLPEIEAKYDQFVTSIVKDALPEEVSIEPPPVD